MSSTEFAATRGNHPLRVFLCHSSGDKAVVRQLYLRLKQHGFAPWLDEEDLIPGQEWQEVIPAAVRMCDAVVVCLSQRSITKEGYVQREIKIALDAAEEKPPGTIFVIPARLEEVEVPKSLQRWHWVSLFQEGGYEKLTIALNRRAQSIDSSGSPPLQQTTTSLASGTSVGQRESGPDQRTLPDALQPDSNQVAESLTGQRAVSPALVSRRFLPAVACLVLLIAIAWLAFRDRIWTPSLPQQKRVAVLPFTFQGTDAANQATAYGLAESLTGNLARLQASEGSLWVVPWLEVRSRKSDDPGRAASSLGVNLLVTGEFRRDSNGLRLQAELKDANSLKELRSKTIEIPAVEVVTLEDRLLEGVTTMLEVRLPPGILHHLPADETAEPGAYEFYEQGRGYLLHFTPATPEDVERAISLLEKTVEKDPNFALAYANLAYAYAIKFHVTHDRRWLDKAMQASDQALKLNNELAYAHWALGSIHQETGDLDGAIQEYERALQLDPSDDATLRRLSQAYDSSGRLLQAEALLKDALKHSPGSFMNYNTLGVFYYQHAQYAEAEPLFRTATELAPDNPVAFYNLGGVYLAEGKYQDAEAILTRAINIKPSAGAYSNLGTIRQYQGRYQDAAAMFQKATEILPDDDRLWYNLGNAYSLAGNAQKAGEAFEKATQLAEKAAAIRSKDGSLLGWLSLYYAKSGKKAKAQEELAKALHSSQNDPQLLFNSVLVYELIGDRERALAALPSAVQAGYSVSEIQSAPELEHLRKDPHFAKIVGNPVH